MLISLLDNTGLQRYCRDLAAMNSVYRNCLEWLQRLNEDKVLAETTCNLLIECWGIGYVVTCVTDITGNVGKMWGRVMDYNSIPPLWPRPLEANKLDAELGVRVKVSISGSV